MKTIIAALLVSTLTNPIVESTSGAKFEVLTETAVTRVNDLGATQTSATVLFSPPGGQQESKRVGVTGCRDGAGIIVVFDMSNNIESGPHSWRTSGPNVFDGVAMAACIAAHLNADRLLRRQGGMV